MADNTSKDTKDSAVKDEKSETSPSTSAVNKTVSCDEKEKCEVTDTDKTSTSEEIASVIAEKVEVAKDIVSLDSKEQQNISKTNCNGNSKEETNLGKEVSLEEIEMETKESNVAESVEASGEEGYLSDVDKKLNDILKVVHEDLYLETLQKTINESTVEKEDGENDSGNERQTTINEEATPEDDTMDSSKEYTSAGIKNKKDKRDSRESSVRTEERSEIGIVGPPTAVSELINEEELRGDSALSTDQKDHIAEWVENSVKVNANEEDNITEECKEDMYEEKDTTDGTAKRRKLNDITIFSRKSQKVVSNIIKKSIKWQTMPQCAVATCRNSHRRTRKQSVRYHRFPHKEEVRELWVRACGRAPLANGEAPFNIKTARVCSRHFLSAFYEDESREQMSIHGNQKRNRLRLGAVPTIDVPVVVEPLRELLNESEKKRSAQTARLKVTKSKRIALSRADNDKARYHNRTKGPNDDADGDDSSAASNSSRSSSGCSNDTAANDVTAIIKEQQSAEQEERQRDDVADQKMDQKHFLKTFSLVHIGHAGLNKMHAMEIATENKRKVNTAEDDKTSRTSLSSKVPENQQNGAALPEETAAASTTTTTTTTTMTTTVGRVHAKKKDEQQGDTEATKSRHLLASTSRRKFAPTSAVTHRHAKATSEPVEATKKRKSTNGQLLTPGNPRKRFCNENEREEYISKIVGDNNETVDELLSRAHLLRNDIFILENLAHTKEVEWNDILRKRMLKEEAYARLTRKIQTMTYMENDDQLPEMLPPIRSSLAFNEWENSGNTTPVSREKSFGSKEDLLVERSLDSSVSKREKTAKVTLQQRATPPKTNGESSRKQNEASSPECRQIGEGRQGAIVDVRSIIADHRLKHPETVPRRGRRMRNSVNIGLGAGGAMMETGHNTDSRPSSTESCKSNPSATDSVNYKDMLVHYVSKLSQQGEPVKVPQNYPDVTLHPVAPSSQNTASQPTGSLLHGILTKAQSPRSTTFSPTLARLLTAPERERNSPAAAAAAAAAAASMSQQSATTQHLLQTYQGSNLVSINDLLSSSKARTEITITPVVNTPAQSHSNDLIQVEDVEEETVIDDRKGNSVGGRDNKQVVKDNPPSPSAPPKCQGCIIRSAQFVCAGCGNQWYCSRACQLAAWATHSDHCPPEPENSKIKSNV